MARLIPPVESFADISNNGERLVAEALVEQLPNDVVVYHSYPWLNVDRHTHTDTRYLQPGEADFIVLDPRRGLLVLEVKDSKVTYEPHNNRWRQKNRKEGTWHTIKPFVQAEKNKYAITKRLEKHHVFAGAPPFTTGHAVVFTSDRYEGPMPPGADPSILLDANALRSMNRAITRAFESWCRVPQAKPMTEGMRAAVLEVLSPVFKLIPVLWRTIDRQEERLHRLTQNQELVLHMLQSQQRAQIQGVAGSGKTLLAVAQAQRLARAGKKTLLVCYNGPLATWIDDNMPDQYADKVKVSTFHGVCKAFCGHAGLPFPRSDDQDFWLWKAPELLEQAADMVSGEHGYDAIVVDEGQDFADFWWVALEKLYRTDGSRPLTVFLDPKQCIYIDRPMLPGDLAGPFMLPTNCRNTRRIASYCAEILTFESEVHPDAPEGVAPNVVVKRDEAGVIQHTRTTVQNWCLEGRGGLRPHQVAILTPWDNHKKWPKRFGNMPLVADFDAWRRGEGVLLATHRRFKGLEADALVLAGVPEPGSSKYYTPADHYVASSRAKHLLEVIRL